jgi:hypothetical protein
MDEAIEAYHSPWIMHEIEWLETRESRQRMHARKRRKAFIDSLPGATRVNTILGRLSTRIRQPRIVTHPDQPQSPLFRLPIEIRYIIWEYVLAKNEVRVVRKFDKLGHAVFPRDMARLAQAEKITIKSTHKIPRTRHRIKSNEVLAQVNLSSPLLICKRL